MTLAVKSHRNNNDHLVNFMDDLLPRHSKTRGAHGAIASNEIEYDDYFAIELAIPGFTKDDFKIAVADDRLSVSLDKEEKKDQGTFRRREFKYGNFEKSWKLGSQINQEKITASYVHGILRLELEKMEMAKKRAPQQIEIS